MCIVDSEIKMSKITKIIIIIFLTTIFAQSCKDPSLDFEWFLFEAEGNYSTENNTSYLKLNAWVEINQSSININPSSSVDSTYFMYASVANWSYRVYSGDQLVFEITRFSIEQILGDIHLNVAIDQMDYLWVAIESENPIEGDIFNGMIPDSVEVEMIIYDDSGGSYTVKRTTPFTFSRN